MGKFVEAPRLAVSTLYISGGDPIAAYRNIAAAGMDPMHNHGMHGDAMYSLADMRNFAGLARGLDVQVKDVHGTHGVEAPRGLCWSTDEPSRQRGAELVRNRVQFAGAIGADVVTLHVAGVSDVPEVRTRQWDAIRRTLDTGAEEGKKEGVQIALENMHYPSFANHDVIRDLLSVYPAERVGVCWDTGHSNNSPDGMDFASSVSDRIIAVHLNDNLGPVDNNVTDEAAAAGDTHFPLYSGTVPWIEVTQILARSPYDGPISMEVGTKHLKDPVAPDVFLRRVHENGLQFAKELAHARSQNN